MCGGTRIAVQPKSRQKRGDGEAMRHLSRLLDGDSQLHLRQGSSGRTISSKRPKPKAVARTVLR
jgi:hypothetical protein